MKERATVIFRLGDISWEMYRTLKSTANRGYASQLYLSNVDHVMYSFTLAKFDNLIKRRLKRK